MDNPLDPSIPRASLSLRPAALPLLSETHVSIRGDPLLWTHRSVPPEDMPGCIGGGGQQGKIGLRKRGIDWRHVRRSCAWRGTRRRRKSISGQRC
jgi:hypothetical protein